MVYDTPSFEIKNEEGGSNYDVIDEFACIFQQIKSINKIYILVSYQRIAMMKRMMEDSFSPLRKFRSSISVVVTKFDEPLTNI